MALVIFVLLAAVQGGGLSARAAMTTTFQISGNFGYELAGVAAPGPPVSGNIALSNLPLGAIPQFVFVYTNDFVGPGTGGGQIDASLTPLSGPAIPIAANMNPNSSDPVPIAQTFGYSIAAPSSAITMNGNYGINIVPSFIGGNANQMAGAGMLVIYFDPLLPMSTITVNEGVLLMGAGGQPNSQTTTFQQLGGMIGAGSNSKLSILTFADDPISSGEQIKFNNSVIGGPIDANLPGGGSASIFNFNVTSLAGSANQATLTSNGDIFGWHVAVLQTPVPEPGGWQLALAGVVGLFAFRPLWRGARC